MIPTLRNAAFPGEHKHNELSCCVVAMALQHPWFSFAIYRPLGRKLMHIVYNSWSFGCHGQTDSYYICMEI